MTTCLVVQHLDVGLERHQLQNTVSVQKSEWLLGNMRCYKFISLSRCRCPAHAWVGSDSNLSLQAPFSLLQPSDLRVGFLQLPVSGCSMRHVRRQSHRLGARQAHDVHIHVLQRRKFSGSERAGPKGAFGSSSSHPLDLCPLLARGHGRSDTTLRDFDHRAASAIAPTQRTSTLR